MSCLLQKLLSQSLRTSLGIFLLLSASVLSPWQITGGLQQAYAATITYVYDDLGRLVGVVDASGDTAVYTYDAVGNLLSVTRHASSTVSIIDFTPHSGPVDTTITIAGTGFSTTPSQNSVTFNGALAPVASSTATQIVATVPAGATTGPISVSAPWGSASSSGFFTVTGSGLPTITGFSPAIGTPATPVTITGTDFEPAPASNKVMFNNVRHAPVSSAAATTIGASVPSGVGSGKLSVTTPVGKAVSSADFFIPPSPYTAADVQVTGRLAIGGSQGVTISIAGKIGLIAFDATAAQRVTLNMTAVTIASTAVTVYNPDGSSLASTSVGTGGGGMNLLFTALQPAQAIQERS